METAIAATPSECVLEDFRFDKRTAARMVQCFVDSELSPCAREQFYAHPNSTIELIQEALFRAVINEMVLRGMATHLAAAEPKEG